MFTWSWRFQRVVSGFTRITLQFPLKRVSHVSAFIGFFPQQASKRIRPEKNRSYTGPGEAKLLTNRKRICLSGNHRESDICQTRHPRTLDPTGLIEEPRTPIDFDEQVVARRK